MKKIKRALISVFFKNDLEPIIRKLDALGVEILSTGGTWDFIRGLGIDAVQVESLTSYPSILGGRVKTLHPKVFGGILARRGFEADQEEMRQYEIPAIDLVIVDLYPFEKTVLNGAREDDIIEKIDIGGIALIRAAAKNFEDVLVVPAAEYYPQLMQLLDSKEGCSTREDRWHFACCAFHISSHYDTQIFNYFNIREGLPFFKHSIPVSQPLRYGENPHQSGLFFGDLTAVFDKLHGKELSYNNLVDVDAALALIREFDSPAVVIVKHTNACGVALRPTLAEAYSDALASDPVSAYGGIIACNREVDMMTADEINKLFFEIILAPAYENNALQLLQSKKNRIILTYKSDHWQGMQFKSLLNGVIQQDKDQKQVTLEDLRTVTQCSPGENETKDLLFANIVAKHSKSNTIVLARDGRLIASGIGQTSRVDALRQAIVKAKSFGFSLQGAVMASDAFFPFADCVEIAHAEGIDAVIQPGGSIRDEDSISYCNEHGMRMVLTGFRHFRH